jgi:hypothetical protein
MTGFLKEVLKGVCPFPKSILSLVGVQMPMREWDWVRD